MAESIEVTAPGLAVFAANCARHSATVLTTAASPPAVPLTSAQATAFAVGEIHAAVSARGAALGQLIAQTAGSAGTSEVQYSTAEAGNAARATLDAIIGA
ncbi:MAG TPA: hypothetical protein VFB19_16250, partial [Mycobacterium sp.]|nr:hypothetical protein [Mycobacterium sp.]